MKQFKFRIINNGRQSLVNSFEEYMDKRFHDYRGESLDIQMAPRDGWFDGNGNRCALSRFGPDGKRLDMIRPVVLSDWEYSPIYEYEEVHPLAHLAKAGLLEKEGIRLSSGGSVPILCTHFNNLGYSAEILFDISGKDQHIVRHYVKQWRNIVRLG